MELFYKSFCANPRSCIQHISDWNTQSIRKKLSAIDEDDLVKIVSDNMDIIPERMLKILDDMEIDWANVSIQVDGKYLDRIIPFLSDIEMKYLLDDDIYEKEYLSMALIESLNLDVQRLSNKKQTEEFYDRFKDELSWRRVAHSIPLELVDKFKEYLDFSILSIRLDLNLDFIRAYGDELYWPFLIARNKDIHEVIEFAPMEKITYHDFLAIALEPYLHEKIIERFWDKLDIEYLSSVPQRQFFYDRYKDVIDWEGASKVIPLECVTPELYPYIDVKNLSFRRDLTAEFVFEHRDFLCWKCISRHISKTPDDCQIESWMRSYLHLGRIDWRTVSRRIPLDLIPDFDSHIDFGEVSERSDLTESIFEMYGDLLDIDIDQYMIQHGLQD